jgi:hypothetical protein
MFVDTTRHVPYSRFNGRDLGILDVNHWQSSRGMPVTRLPREDGLVVVSAQDRSVAAQRVLKPWQSQMAQMWPSPFHSSSCLILANINLRHAPARRLDRVWLAAGPTSPGVPRGHQRLQAVSPSNAASPALFSTDGATMAQRFRHMRFTV